MIAFAACPTEDDGGSDPAPIASVSVSPVSVNEGGAVTATVTLDRAFDSAATFTLALGATAATDDVDADVDGANDDDDATFSEGSNTAVVSIATGGLTGSAEITIVDDDASEEAEEDETFTVGLAAGTNGVTLSEAVATVTISRNDQAMATQVNSFSASSGSVSEGGEPATITIGLDGPAITPLSFGYTIGVVEAADIEGNALSGTIGVALGAQSGTATISAANDTLIEGVETMIIKLASTNAPLTIAGSVGQIQLTIDDNDTLSVGLADPTYAFAEDAATPTVLLNVSGGALVGSDAEVSLTTSAGTATEADFTARSADPAVPILVDDYTTEQTISVPLAITDDTILEIDETFSLRLSASDGRVEVGSSSAAVTIMGGGDPVTATIGIAATATEGETVTATVMLDNRVGVDTTLTLELRPTTDTSDTDADVDGVGDDDASFSGGSNPVTIAAGMTTGSADITITNDDATEEAEEAETFVVGFIAGAVSFAVSGGGAIPEAMINVLENHFTAISAQVVTIPRNDQTEASLVTSFTATPTTIGEDGGDVTIAIVLDGEAQSPLSFGYAITGIAAADIADDDADSDGDALTGTIDVAQTNEMGMATIAIADDALIEGDETMTITLDTPPSGIMATGIDPVEVTIGDNDTLSVGLADPTYAFAEDAATPAVLLNVSGGELVGSPAEVSLTTSAGTATEADFTARSGADAVVPIPVADYTTAQTISVPLAITDDTILEIDETFSLRLSAPDGRVEVGSSSAAVTIMGGGDPVTATIGIEPSTATEGETVTATVTLTNPVGVDTTLTLELRSTTDPSDLDADVDGSSPDDASFSGGSNAVTIDAGMTTGSIDITITDDAAIEEDETFVVGFPVGAVSFAVSGGGTIPEAMISVLENHFTAIDAQVVTIPRNDQTEASLVTSFTATPTTIGEDGGDVTIAIVLNGEAQSPLSFGYAISGIAAADIVDDDADSDGDALTGTIDVAQTNEMGMATITIEDDALIEDDETMTITIGTLPTDSGSGNMLDYATGINGEEEVTITDDDMATVSIEATTATAVEGGADGEFTVSLTGGTTTDAVVVPLDIGGDAAVGDYTLSVTSPVGLTGSGASRMLTIPMGATSATITVTAAGDGDVTDETLTLTIGTGITGGGRVGAVTRTPTTTDRSASVTLQDDDYTAIVEATIQAVEGGASGEFTITLDRDVSAGTVTVNYTVAGTATAGTDYTALTGSVTITTGDTADVVVTVDDDDLIEVDETVILTIDSDPLGSGSVLVGSPATATVTITDNDKLMVEFVSNPYTFAEGQTTPPTNAMLSVVGVGGGTLVAPVDVEVTTTGGTADSNVDFMERGAGASTINIPAADYSSPVTLNVPLMIIDDMETESSETFNLTLAATDPRIMGVVEGNPTSLGDTSVTITDNDGFTP